MTALVQTLGLYGVPTKEQAALSRCRIWHNVDGGLRSGRLSHLTIFGLSHGNDPMVHIEVEMRQQGGFDVPDGLLGLHFLRGEEMNLLNLTTRTCDHPR